MPDFARTPEEVNELVNRLIEKPGPRWPGMSFEDGCRAVAEWVLGDTDDHPLEDSDAEG